MLEIQFVFERQVVKARDVKIVDDISENGLGSREVVTELAFSGILVFSDSQQVPFLCLYIISELAYSVMQRVFGFFFLRSPKDKWLTLQTGLKRDHNNVQISARIGDLNEDIEFAIAERLLRNMSEQANRNIINVF